jgi:hypothetical protein
VLAIDFAASLAFAIGLGAQLRYLKKLAARLPDPKLSNLASGIKNTFPICYALMVGWQHYLIFAPGFAAPPTSVQMFFGCAGSIASLGSLFCFINYMHVLRTFSQRLAQERTLSELIWDPDVLPSIIPK